MFTRDYVIFNYLLSQIIGPTRNPSAKRDQILAPEFVMISFIEKDMISHLLVTRDLQSSVSTSLLCKHYQFLLLQFSCFPDKRI